MNAPWRRPFALLLCAVGAAGCARSGGRALTAPLDPLPPPAMDTSGPLAIDVVYPPVFDTVPVPRAVVPIAARDSTFLFGSVGRGDARLTVNGLAIPVHPNGAWLAWVPLPDDSVARFTIAATAGDASDRYEFAAALPRRFDAPSTGPWIDTTSFGPTGDIWLRPAEGLRLSVRAAPDASVTIRLPGDRRIVLVPESGPVPVPWGERAFGTEPPGAGSAQFHRYAGWWTGAVGPDPGHVLSPEFPTPVEDTAWAWLEVVLAGDTARAVWPLRVGIVDPDVPPVAIVNDDTAGTGTTDRTLAGRPAPFGTYHWFFPNGTRVAVSGRRNSQVRLQLSERSVAWVNVTDVQPLAPGTPPVRGTTQAFRLASDERSVTLRVPLPGRVPFRVDEEERRVALTVYGVAANADWIQYGGTDPLVRLIAFHAPAEDETLITVDLAEPVWGYRTRWDGNDLLLEIRRPPAIDPRDPLRGRLIALDPGHPPGGATGPTRVYEGDVVLAVARFARALMEARGARVVLLRDDSLPRSLVDRTEGAEALDAEVLVSVHANALPDGVNPFTNNGTSVYYFHPRSAPLARAIDRALVRRLGVRDLGVGRGDLALARPTWMPAVLTEGLFMMVPEQEAMLASPEGQRRYAEGIVDGLATFLRERVERR